MAAASLQDTHDPVAGKLIRSYAASLFAEFAVRIAAAALDAFLLLYLVVSSVDWAFAGLDVHETMQSCVASTIVVVSCALFWSSPIRATPFQFLLGMRVLNESGDRLKFVAALVRSITLVGLIFAALYVFNLQSIRYASYLGFVPVTLLFLATLTPHRQGLHDLLAHSVVINRRATKTEDQQERMLTFLADDDPLSRRYRRPTIYRMVVDTVVMAIPLFVISIAIQAGNDKDTRAATAYAVSSVGGHKAAIEEFYYFENRWPENEMELGVEMAGKYPDGGGYRIGENGVINIYFSVNPALTKGSLVLVPGLDDGLVTWSCYNKGSIKTALLISQCRERFDGDIALAQKRP